MNLIKMGCFIKELRKEKNLSQEELAYKFDISRRTVSRWETGTNMPDIDVLIEMADFFGVELREILTGERKTSNMNEDTKVMLKEVTEYEKECKKRMAIGSITIFSLGFVLLGIYFIIRVLDIASTPFVDYITGFVLGFSIVTMIFGIVYSARQLKHFSKK